MADTFLYENEYVCFRLLPYINDMETRRMLVARILETDGMSYTDIVAFCYRYKLTSADSAMFIGEGTSGLRAFFHGGEGSCENVLRELLKGLSVDDKLLKKVCSGCDKCSSGRNRNRLFEELLVCAAYSNVLPSKCRLFKEHMFCSSYTIIVPPQSGNNISSVGVFSFSLAEKVFEYLLRSESSIFVRTEDVSADAARISASVLASIGTSFKNSQAAIECAFIPLIQRMFGEGSPSEGEILRAYGIVGEAVAGSGRSAGRKRSKKRSEAPVIDNEAAAQSLIDQFNSFVQLPERSTDDPDTQVHVCRNEKEALAESAKNAESGHLPAETPEPLLPEAPEAHVSDAPPELPQDDPPHQDAPLPPEAGDGSGEDANDPGEVETDNDGTKDSDRPENDGTDMENDELKGAKMGNEGEDAETDMPVEDLSVQSEPCGDDPCENEASEDPDSSGVSAGDSVSVEAAADTGHYTDSSDPADAASEDSVSAEDLSTAAEPFIDLLSDTRITPVNANSIYYLIQYLTSSVQVYCEVVRYASGRGLLVCSSHDGPIFFIPASLCGFELFSELFREDGPIVITCNAVSFYALARHYGYNFFRDIISLSAAVSAVSGDTPVYPFSGSDMALLLPDGAGRDITVCVPGYGQLWGRLFGTIMEKKCLKKYKKHVFYEYAVSSYCEASKWLSIPDPEIVRRRFFDVPYQNLIRTNRKRHFGMVFSCDISWGEGAGGCKPGPDFRTEYASSLFHAEPFNDSRFNWCVLYLSETRIVFFAGVASDKAVAFIRERILLSLSSVVKRLGLDAPRASVSVS